MNYPLFDFVPDFSKPPTYLTVTAQERLGLTRALDTAFFPENQPTTLFAFSFVLTAATEIRRLKEFYRERGGRTFPFYLPSWRADLPAVSGSVSTSLLTVTQLEDYNAAHFTAGHADDKGRQIFIWQAGEGLFTADVVAAQTSGGNVVLNLSKLLPFTLDPSECIIGFCHLARFEDEEITFDHIVSSIAKIDLKLRAIRQWNGEADTFDANGFNETSPIVKGFISAAVTAEDTQPIDTRVAWANGPATLHSATDPYGTGWAAWLNPDGIRLKKATSPPPFTQATPDNTGTLTTLFPYTATEHVSIAYDLAGWEVLAIQLDPETIRLRRNGTGVETFTFPGLDPILFATGELLAPELSAIVCWYRKAGDPYLFYRTSADSFAAEHVSTHLPVMPIKLKRAYKSGGNVKLELVDAGFRRVILTSGAYL